MVTSFFSKSRPITFALLGCYLMVFYVIANWEPVLQGGFSSFLMKLGVLVVLGLNVVLLDFILKRNELTSRNAYKIVLFAAFFSMFLPALRNEPAILANLFIILALRRIVSLRVQKNTAQKIFDATLWIGIASLFYFWCILFLFLVFFGILVHEGFKFRNWLVPLVSLILLFSIVTTGDLIITDSFYTFNDWFDRSNFDFSNYRSPGLLIPVAFLSALLLWSSFFFVGHIQRANASSKNVLFIILLFTLVAIGVAFLSPVKNGSELVFLFAPLTIIVTNYFQISRDNWFREVLLWGILLLPMVLVWLQG